MNFENLEGTEASTKDIKIAEIEIGTRLRQLDLAYVDQLAESIAEIGLQSPITLYYQTEFTDQPTMFLVTGLHRLEACRKLGHETIAAIITDLDADDRRLWEIDENLVRAPLTELERGEHLKQREDIFRWKGGASCATPGGQQAIGFAKETAEKVGLSKSTINRSLRRAKRIPDDVREELRDMDAANEPAELDALAAMSHTNQRKAVKRVRKGTDANFREARDVISLSQKKQREKSKKPQPDINDLASKLASKLSKILDPNFDERAINLEEIINDKELDEDAREPLVHILDLVGDRFKDFARQLDHGDETKHLEIELPAENVETETVAEVKKLTNELKAAKDKTKIPRQKEQGQKVRATKLSDTLQLLRDQNDTLQHELASKAKDPPKVA